MIRNLFSYGTQAKQSPSKLIRIKREQREKVKRLSEIIEKKNGMGQESNLRKCVNLTHVSNQDDLGAEISDDETIPFQEQDADSRDSLQNEFANQRKELDSLESRLDARVKSPGLNNKERIDNEETNIYSKKQGLTLIKRKDYRSPEPFGHRKLDPSAPHHEANTTSKNGTGYNGSNGFYGNPGFNHQSTDLQIT